MTNTPDAVIFVVPETLSDRSVVFNVLIGSLKLAACSEEDASELAEKLQAAIEAHTVSSAGVVYEAA